MELPFHINLENKVAVVTGGSGVLGSVLSEALAEAGASVVVLARNKDKVDAVTERIQKNDGTACGYSVDVLDPNALEEVHQDVLARVGSCDILINGAGGNHPQATTSQEKLDPEAITDDSQQTFFDLDPNAVKNLFDLIFIGALLPTQVFAKDMVEKEEATVINISSMNADRPLTKIPAYSGAKAAVSNFTQWLAVHFADVGIRVNAVAPGFFLTDQNRALMYKDDGSLSERAHKILAQTPDARFGEPEELVGALLWLVNARASGFVNGIVVPVDGGFSAYSGV
ncbi:SDR family NAD(P)-dependent oxidoreductase [Salicibibacter halophilus]|uniref:SDR family NAD(P)-dependent oxidoreductase n=1 Tax=Salicibibacter halophilus TaxID=2502791 RepID=A0A514LLY7_9BACI|nr:SDR family oxidoreductase [Salicibibacter halophilus]QDI92882.1 SDR family NAD(P)-dependent oxidoreductase [Salicibibacter halophilus]